MELGAAFLNAVLLKPFCPPLPKAKSYKTLGEDMSEDCMLDKIIKLAQSNWELLNIYDLFAKLEQLSGVKARQHLAFGTAMNA